MVADLPFLDLTAPGFSTRGAQVLAARAAQWCARTPTGLAVLRHRQAGQLLRDRRLRQGSHAWPGIIGINGSFAEFWQRSIISQEGERHRLLRRIAQTALAEDFVQGLQPQFGAIAEGLLAQLKADAEFDAVANFTEPFAGQAITTLLALPETAAPALARDASTLGLAMGPDAPRHQTAVNAACDRLSALSGQMIDAPPASGFVARLLAAAHTAGVEDKQALTDLIVISIFGGVDTTRAQLAFALWLFARHPDQWTWLRSKPAHILAALEEVIRTRPTTTWATREALEDFEFDGVEITAGQTLHILVHATATDPAVTIFDGFDIRADRKMHFGFGGGAHACLGQFVARTDMAVAMAVLLRRWRAIRLAGEAEFLPDSGNTSPTRLPVRPDWA